MGISRRARFWTTAAISQPASGLIRTPCLSRQVGFEAIGILDSKLKTYGVWAAPTAPAKVGWLRHRRFVLTRAVSASFL